LDWQLLIGATETIKLPIIVTAISFDVVSNTKTPNSIMPSPVTTSGETESEFDPRMLAPTR